MTQSDGGGLGSGASPGHPARAPAVTASILEHLDIVLDSLTDHAVLTLDLDGNITSWNRGAELTKGYAEAEIIGRNFACFYTPEDQEAGLPQSVLRAAKEQGRHEMQGWRVRKNGERFWANVTIQPLNDERGEISGFVKVTRDISQQLRLEELKEQFVRAQKDDLIGQLAGGIAHDFNNLLTALEAGHQLVRNFGKDQRINRVLDVNAVAMDRSRKLIAQLLAFSGQQVLKPELTQVNEVAAVFDALIERAIGATLQIEWKLENTALTEIDPAQFQSALLNLIFNARDATPAGGSVRIFSETVTVPGQPYKLMDELNPGKYVVFGVADTGVGMDDATLRRATEPFFTTKDIGKGTGLGLSQCYGFARQSGGTLAIESKAGAGTVVRMLLPATALDEIASAGPFARTILLVDDEAAIRELVGELLRTLGHTVFLAEDAREALELLRRNISIDYLFTDIIMPNGMNGLQLVEEARTIKPGLPSLLASGYSRETLKNIAQLRDDITFLQKPYTMSQLALQFSQPPNGTSRS